MINNKCICWYLSSFWQLRQTSVSSCLYYGCALVDMNSMIVIITVKHLFSNGLHAKVLLAAHALTCNSLQILQWFILDYLFKNANQMLKWELSQYNQLIVEVSRIDILLMFKNHIDKKILNRYEIKTAHNPKLCKFGHFTKI